jgi:serine/threonine protein kinase
MLRLQRVGEKMPVDTIWSYLIQIVDGLHFMHDPTARNNPDVPGTLVHGDLKPNNSE